MKRNFSVKEIVIVYTFLGGFELYENTIKEVIFTTQEKKRKQKEEEKKKKVLCFITYLCRLTCFHKSVLTTAYLE